MPRLINLDELLTAIDQRNGRLPLWLDEILMEDCKVVDAVEVVRCKDCKYFQTAKERRQPMTIKKSIEAREIARDDFYKSASPPDAEKYCVGGNVGEPLMFAVSFYCPKCKQEIMRDECMCFNCHTRIDWRDVKLKSNERYEYKTGVSIRGVSLSEVFNDDKQKA